VGNIEAASVLVGRQQLLTDCRGTEAVVLSWLIEWHLAAWWSDDEAKINKQQQSLTIDRFVKCFRSACYEKAWSKTHVLRPDLTQCWRHYFSVQTKDPTQLVMISTDEIRHQFVWPSMSKWATLIITLPRTFKLKIGKPVILALRKVRTNFDLHVLLSFRSVSGTDRRT